MVLSVEMASYPTDKDISSSHLEEQQIGPLGEMKIPMSDLKLDSEGLPLVPQPSDNKEDPLVSRPLRMCQAGGLLVLIPIIAELAEVVQILRSALTLLACVYRTM